MKRIFVIMSFLSGLLMCNAQNQLTERGKDMLNEYISGIQGGVDVTPLVISIKDLYGTANAVQKQEFRDVIVEEIAGHLSNNQKEFARSLINIYQMIAERNDERLPKLYFILGNIYAEQKDTTNLKNTISFLEKCANNSGYADEFVNTLNDHLEHIRNYVPATFDIDGIWITDIAKNINHNWYKIPLYQVEVTKGGGGREQFFIDGSKIESFNNKHFWSGLVFRDNNAFSQIEKEFGEDSLYLFWSSEKISNADLQDIAIRRQMTGVLGTTVAVRVSNGSGDIGNKMAGQVVGGLVEIGANAIFDRLFEPSKRIVIIEAWLKRVNANMFEGVFSWKESKIANNTSNINFEETTDYVTLMRWKRESDVLLIGSDVTLNSQKKPYNRTHFMYTYRDYLPYVSLKALKKSPNPELRQIYQYYKEKSIKDKPDFLRNYNCGQIEKLKKWCLENK